MPRLIVAVIVSLLLAPVVGQCQEIVEQRTGEVFPATIVVGEGAEATELRATGAALRKKFFWKIYVAVGYVDGSLALQPDPGEAMVYAEAPRQIHLRMLRDVGAGRITGGIDGALEKCAIVPLEGLADQRSRLRSVLEDDRELPEGSDLRLTYLPGEGLRVSLDDQVLDTIPGEDFANSVFAIYFGKSPIDDDMKRDLLSAIP